MELTYYLTATTIGAMTAALIFAWDARWSARKAAGHATLAEWRSNAARSVCPVTAIQVARAKRAILEGETQR